MVFNRARLVRVTPCFTMCSAVTAQGKGDVCPVRVLPLLSSSTTTMALAGEALLLHCSHSMDRRYYHSHRFPVLDTVLAYTRNNGPVCVHGTAACRHRTGVILKWGTADGLNVSKYAATGRKITRPHSSKTRCLLGDFVKNK